MMASFFGLGALIVGMGGWQISVLSGLSQGQDAKIDGQNAKIDERQYGGPCTERQDWLFPPLVYWGARCID